MLEVPFFIYVCGILIYTSSSRHTGCLLYLLCSQLFCSLFFLSHLFHVRQDILLILQSTKFFLLGWSMAFVLKHGGLQRIRNLSSPGRAVLWSEGKSPLSGHLAFKLLLDRSLEHVHVCGHINRGKLEQWKLTICKLLPNKLFHNSRFYRDTELTYNACKQINNF